MVCPILSSTHITHRNAAAPTYREKVTMLIAEIRRLEGTASPPVSSAPAERIATVPTDEGRDHEPSELILHDCRHRLILYTALAPGSEIETDMAPGTNEEGNCTAGFWITYGFQVKRSTLSAFKLSMALATLWRWCVHHPLIIP